MVHLPEKHSFKVAVFCPRMTRLSVFAYLHCYQLRITRQSIIYKSPAIIERKIMAFEMGVG
jgi:hypothetical protein